MQRVLGLDVGAKRIGVALSDELGFAGYPLAVIDRAGIAADIRVLKDLAAQYHVGDVIVGMPLELSGRVGKRARIVKQLIDAIAQAIPECTIHEWDERFSTSEALTMERTRSMTRRPPTDIDARAAALILQGWLDRQRQENANTAQEKDDPAQEEC